MTYSSTTLSPASLQSGYVPDLNQKIDFVAPGLYQFFGQIVEFVVIKHSYMLIKLDLIKCYLQT